MGIQEAVFLGIVQGLTEFLPISSSGHLVIFEHLLGVKPPGVSFEVALHLGTAAAVLLVYWADVLWIFKGFFQWILKRKYASGSGYLLLLIIVGSVPAGVAGVFLEDFFASLFQKPVLVGFSLLVTGLLLLLADNRAKKGKDFEAITWIDALIIGLGQAVAIVPGISRSGATISTAILLGIDRVAAARFSFLLALPAILGAGLLSLMEAPGSIPLDPRAILLGTVVSAITGVVAIKWLLNVLAKGRLKWFAYYCWIVGIAAIIWYTYTYAP